MRRDISDVLRAAAHVPDTETDVTDVRRRAEGVRRGRRIRGAVTAVVALAVVSTAVVVPVVGARRERVVFDNRPLPTGAAVAPGDRAEEETRTAQEQARHAAEEARKAKARDLRRRCRNGPRGVVLRPSSGPPGTRVRFSGHCFVGAFSDERQLMGGYGIFLIRPALDRSDPATRPNAPTCELIGGAEPADITIRDGAARGYFTVPVEGSCFQENRTEPFVPGRYLVGLGYHSGSMNATFTVVPKVSRDGVCAASQVELMPLETDAASGQTLLFVGVRLVGADPCYLDTVLKATVLTRDGEVVKARGNPAEHRLAGPLRRQAPRLTLWGWGSNHCGRQPLRLRVEVEGYGQRTDVFDGLDDSGGGADPSCKARFRLSEPPGG